MSKRDLLLLIEDMLDAVNKILKYTSGLNYEQFIHDEKTIDATVRNFEIIGEAANRIPEDYKLQHPEIEWRQIIGLRNRIIHEYFGIDYVCDAGNPGGLFADGQCDEYSRINLNGKNIITGN